MEKRKIGVGIGLINIWVSLCIILNIGYTLLVWIGIIDDQITYLDNVGLLSSTLFLVLMMAGLYFGKKWAWILFVSAILLSWILVLFHIFNNYVFGIGMLYSVIGFASAFMLKFLFHPSVREHFNIQEKVLIRLECGATLLFITSFYILAFDIVGGIIGSIATLIVSMSILLARRREKQ